MSAKGTTQDYFSLTEGNVLELLDPALGLLVGGKNIFGANLVANVTGVTSNGTSTIAKADIGTGVTVGDAVIIYGGGTEADFGLYLVKTVNADNLVLDRAVAGSDSDLLVNIFADGVIIENFTSDSSPPKGRILLGRGTAALPSLAFEDGRVGIRGNGTTQLMFITVGVERIVVGNTGISARNVNGGGIINVGATYKVPSISTNALNDPNTGLGWAGADQLTLVAGGVEGIRIKEDTRIDVSVNGAVNYAADDGSENAYEAEILAITTLAAGLTVTFLANTTNTGGATLKVVNSADDLTAKDIKKQHNVDLVSGNIEDGQIVVVVYDGTNWQMVSQLAN